MLVDEGKVCKDILEICKPIFREFNVTFFSQTRAFHDGQFAALMTDIQLSEYYIDQKYPFYYSQGKGIILNSGVYIESHLGELSQQKIREEIKSFFNIDHIIYVIEHQNNYDDMFAFATTPENTKIVNEFINNLEFVKHFILYYKDKSLNLIKKVNKRQYGCEHFPPKISCPSGTTIPNSHQKNLQDMPIRKVLVSTRGRNVYISNREFDCLKYAVKNYSLKEIGKLLGLSPRTVETYVNNLKYKLQCDSRSQLIDVASKLNIA